MRIISVRENPEHAQRAIEYISACWSEISPVIYQNCIENCLQAEQSLPQWYLLEKEGALIGCAGLITNDFISRMDLYPWVCAMFIDEKYRGNNYGEMLINKAKADTKSAGFKHLHLCTDHNGYYEKFGFKYIGQGFHPWDAESRIYQVKV